MSTYYPNVDEIEIEDKVIEDAIIHSIITNKKMINKIKKYILNEIEILDIKKEYLKNE